MTKKEIEKIVETVFNNYKDVDTFPNTVSVNRSKIRRLVESLISMGIKVIAVKKPVGYVALEEPLGLVKYQISSYKIDKKHHIEFNNSTGIVLLYQWCEYMLLEENAEIIRFTEIKGGKTRTITAACTWGYGPDVIVSLNGKPFICYEDPKNDPPPRGQWKHGYVSEGSFDLTQDEARRLAYDLLQASDSCREIGNTYEEYCEISGDSDESY